MISIKSLKKWQKKVFLLSWLAYVCAYLLRTNLSIVLPDMIESLNFSRTEAGLLGTVFFWVYAFGQLINGNIGDRVNTRKFVFIGLFCAAIVNLIVGASSNYILILILWGCNGFFLSILWGPLIKTLSFWFDSGNKTKIAAGISTSMVGGFLLSWGVVGQIIAFTNWRWAFWLPAIIAIIYSFFWLQNIKNHPNEVGLNSPNKLINDDKTVNNVVEDSIFKIIIEYKLWLVAITSISVGLIREGIILWGPTYLSELYGISQSTVSFISLFIPVLMLPGILGAWYVNNKLNYKDELSIIFFILASALSVFILNFVMFINVYIDAILLGLGVAFLFGANMLLLGVIPMNYADKNKVSGIAGFLDFCTYIGAAVGGVLVGYIVDNFSWELMIVIWTIISLMGIVSIYSKIKSN